LSHGDGGQLDLAGLRNWYFDVGRQQWLWSFRRRWRGRGGSSLSLTSRRSQLE
jgi:hypothetical protein